MAGKADAAVQGWDERRVRIKIA